MRIEYTTEEGGVWKTAYILEEWVDSKTPKEMMEQLFAGNYNPLGVFSIAFPGGETWDLLPTGPRLRYSLNPEGHNPYKEEKREESVTELFP